MSTFKYEKHYFLRPGQTIFIGSDHAGFKLKTDLIDYLKKTFSEVDIIDVGCYSDTVACDYPDFARQVAQNIQTNPASSGVLICGTGQGMIMTANKFENIRAGIAWSPQIAATLRQHNHANVLALPARHIDTITACNILESFLITNQSSSPRHVRRVSKITS